MSETDEIRLLLVDDDAAVIRGYERILTRHGVVVTTAANGREAAEHVRSRSFDVILSDVSMPQMTGIDFLKSVRAHDLDVPVILMTGNPTVESAAGAVEYGAFRYLAKPVPPDELCTIVLHASRLHKLARLKAEAMLLPGGHGDSSHQSRRGDGHEGNDMVSESDGAARRELCVGDVVGERYLLRRELGRGAGGVVFEAIHRLTERSTAVKVVSTDVPRSQVAEQSARLVREARALATVRHAGVVEVLDGGVLEDGTPFIVLEKLDGRTLEGLLAARGRLSRDDAVAIGLQLCDSLDAMHRVGVVHRDLKPGNLFVVRDRDDIERIKLLDFGIVALTRAEREKLTAFGAVIGTPAYMSREQLLALDVDERADVYALGVTLFECLSGRLPYEGNYQAVLLQVCAPNAKAPRLIDLIPDVGDELSSVVEQATAVDRDDRFASARDFGRALYAAMPAARSKTFFLGPPPLPKFGSPASRQLPSHTQRRSAPRAAYVTPAQIKVGDASIDGHTEDISEGGLLFICRSRCESGGLATVRFALPIDGKVVTCQAHVRWVRAARPNEPEGPRAIGLEFLEVTDEGRSFIARYVTLMGSVAT